MDSTSMKTPLTELLDLRYPIIQAPMAGVSTPALAAAVSNAGGLGSVALGALSPSAAKACLLKTMALTDRPLAANLFVHDVPTPDPQIEARFLAELAPHFEAAGVAAPKAVHEIYRSFNEDEAMLEMLLQTRPAAVSLHFGLASEKIMSELRGAGIRVLATATSVVEALAVERSGVDVLVMQSFGAGGHSGAFLGPPDPETAGRAGLIGLIRETIAAVGVPVVAAGGLMTGQDVAEVIEAGACGAQLGTAFVPCPETLASDAYRRKLLAGTSTQLTSNISGRPARGVENELMAWANSVQSQPPDYPRCYDAVKQLVAAKQEPEFSVMWAGEGAAAARAYPAEQMLHQLGAELAAAAC